MLIFFFFYKVNMALHFMWKSPKGWITQNGKADCPWKSKIKNKQEGQDGPVSLTWLPDKFESIGLSVHEKNFNIDFQDGGHLGFPIRMSLGTFDLQVTAILPMKFESIAHLVQEKKFKIDFQHGC